MLFILLYLSVFNVLEWKSCGANVDCEDSSVPRHPSYRPVQESHRVVISHY